jgi:dienelactone hydrolase
MPTEPEHIRVAGVIPAVIWRGAGRGARPAIISVHGLGGRKEDVDLEIVERLTSRGITLVTVDAYLHGEHIPPGQKRPESYAFATLLAALVQTVQDLSTLVAHLQQDQAIDGQRFGLRGGSMGGYIALAAVGQNLPVRAVLSICGAADYPNTFGPHLRGENPALSPTEVAQARERWEEVRPLDPLLRVARFPPRSILMIHGACDPLVPIAGHRALYDALVPYYAERPEDCLFITHAGEHATPLSLERFGWDWLIGRLVKR